MTHLAYVAAAYAIAVGMPLALSVAVLFRVRAARRQLEAIDTRRNGSY